MPDHFRVVDKDGGKNIADQFATKAEAKKVRNAENVRYYGGEIPDRTRFVVSRSHQHWRGLSRPEQSYARASAKKDESITEEQPKKRKASKKQNAAE